MGQTELTPRYVSDLEKRLRDSERAVPRGAKIILSQSYANLPKNSGALTELDRLTIAIAAGHRFGKLISDQLVSFMGLGVEEKLMVQNNYSQKKVVLKTISQDIYKEIRGREVIPPDPKIPHKASILAELLRIKKKGEQLELDTRYFARTRGTTVARATEIYEALSAEFLLPKVKGAINVRKT